MSLMRAPLARGELVAIGTELVRRLGGQWREGGGMCLCPAHADRSPSLSVRIGRSNLLFHCFAGCTNPEVIAAVRRLQPQALSETYPALERSGDRDSWSRARARNLWDEARRVEGTKAERYLHARAITMVSSALRYHASAPLGRGRTVALRPALIARVSDDHGLVAVQRTFLEPLRARRARDLDNPRRLLGRPEGGAVRFLEPDTELGLAEGVETALSAIMLLDIPVWAVLGNERFARVTIPDRVNRLVLLPDNDRAGRRGAALAHEAHSRPGRRIETLLPWAHVNDWNDVFRSEGKGEGVRVRFAG